MKKTELEKTINDLNEAFPDAHCELNFDTPYQLMVATILSAQCTDKRVNEVTKILFKKYPDVYQMAKLDLEEIEKLIYSTGFYKNKAKNILKNAKLIIEKYNGEVPRSMKELITLPGVGRKTANCILSNGFNINVGIVVDTHVKRITNLLGWTNSKTPEKIEIDLMNIIPQDLWGKISHLLIFLGRRYCVARRPKCSECPIKIHCPVVNKSKLF
jgi:endonuclease-3